jgi:co-chaperonin GroES (HSP10)
LPEKANQKALSARAAKGAVEVKPVPLANGIANQEDKLIPRNAAQATFNDLAVGDKVLVSLAAGDEPRTARLVLITKHKPQVMKTIKGEVMAVGDGKITIKTADSEITLSYDKDTVFTLKGVIAVAPGQQARVAYDSEKMLARRVGIN